MKKINREHGEIKIHSCYHHDHTSEHMQIGAKSAFHSLRIANQFHTIQYLFL